MLMLAVFWGVSGLRKKIPSMHGRKRAAQSSTLTKGGRVDTSLADTERKKEPFFADTGISFLRVVGIDSEGHHVVLARSHSISQFFLRLLSKGAAPLTRGEW